MVVYAGLTEKRERDFSKREKKYEMFEKRKERKGGLSCWKGCEEERRDIVKREESKVGKEGKESSIEHSGLFYLPVCCRTDQYQKVKLFGFDLVIFVCKNKKSPVLSFIYLFILICSPPLNFHTLFFSPVPLARIPFFFFFFQLITFMKK